MINITGGAFQSDNNAPIALGSIVFQLNQAATVTANPYGVVTSLPITFQLDSNGNILAPTGSANAQIWSNAELTPTTTFYYVTVYDQNGARCFSVIWQFTQAASSTVALGSMQPYTP